MPWQLRLPYLINQAVGVSLVNGQGVSGILCRFDSEGIYLMEYLYRTQFATKHYRYGQIQDIIPFPSCFPVPTPFGPVF